MDSNFDTGDGISGFFDYILRFKTDSLNGKKYIKGTVAWLTVYVVLIVNWLFFENLPDEFFVHDNILFSLTIVIDTFVGYLAFVWACMYVMKKEGVESGKFKDYFGQGIVVVLALEIYIAGMTILPEQIRDHHFLDGTPYSVIISSIIGLSPMIFAGLFYKLAMVRIDALKAGPENPERIPLR